MMKPCLNRLFFCLLFHGCLVAQDSSLPTPPRQPVQLPAPVHYYFPDYRNVRFINPFEKQIAVEKKEPTDSELERSARVEFNGLLRRLERTTSMDSVGFNDRILLFQTTESLTNKTITHVFSGTDTVHHIPTDFTRQTVQNLFYNSCFQREIVIDPTNDSTQITNWYIRQWTLDEQSELTKNRWVYQRKVDSLKNKIRALHVNDGMPLWGNEIDLVRRQIDSITPILDSIDYLIYPSISEKISEFVNEHYYDWRQPTKIDFAAENISRYSNFKKGSDEIEFRKGEKADFENKRFRMICVISDGSNTGQSAYYGDSAIYSGADIIENLMYDDLSSGSSEWNRQLTLFDELYLIVESYETYIGETYHYVDSTTYWFEIVH